MTYPPKIHQKDIKGGESTPHIKLTNEHIQKFQKKPGKWEIGWRKQNKGNTKILGEDEIFLFSFSNV